MKKHHITYAILIFIIIVLVAILSTLYWKTKISESTLDNYSFTTTVDLYEIENPDFSYTQTCQKIINEKYPNRDCVFNLGEIEYLSLGSKNQCIITCQDQSIPPIINAH